MRREFHLLPYTSITRIAEEWDSLAPIRLKQILSGSDITFNEVMLPNMLTFISQERSGSLLDAGCGVGILTDALSPFFREALGIDASQNSIAIAKEHFSNSSDFHWASIEQLALLSRRKFDVITANMVLMDAPNLNSFAESVFKLLKPGGAFLFSITHPCFWPSYYGYEDESWYEYQRELIIESPFRISSEPDCRMLSTHIHRPIEMYTSCFFKAGLQIESLVEPFPNEEIHRRYRDRWRYPRYLLGRCRRPKGIRLSSKAKSDI